ncbi:MAG: trypsin-like serine protease [Bradymonadales bacterium]|nr:trypsin-like serine protease [Bradymonadales bacterium]
MIENGTRTSRHLAVASILSLLFFLSGWAGCTFQPEPVVSTLASYDQTGQAIINGTSTDAWPAIGALVIEAAYVASDDLRQFCSGTLIDPEWVMTAGHCVVVELPTESEETIELTPEMVSFFIGPDVSGSGSLFAIDSFHPHPQFIPNAPLVRDIALAHLAERVPAEVAQPLPINDLLITYDWEGLPITWVGYGVTDGIRQTGNGIKRYGEGLLGPVALDMFAYEMSEDGQLPCNGDSGGATLLDIEGVETVIGVTHMGDQGCASSGMDTRVDPFYTWIQGLLETTRIPCEITGGDCESGQACQPSDDRFECSPSQDLAAGSPCLVEPESWPPYPCADGLACLDLPESEGGVGPACYPYCLVDEDCSEMDRCLTGVVDDDHPDLGACVCRDEDADGFCRQEDCDDQNPQVHPLATEVCEDGIDNNCNGLTDWEDTDTCNRGHVDTGCSVTGLGGGPSFLLLLWGVAIGAAAWWRRSATGL